MTITPANTLTDPRGIDTLANLATASARFELLPWIIVAAAFLAATLAAWSLARRVGGGRPRHAPSFRRLCRGLGLAPAQRRLLLRLAACGSPQVIPATLLVSRGCFDRAAAAPTAAASSHEVDRLRLAIFGADGDSEPAAV